VIRSIFIAIALFLLGGCDKQVPQTVVVRANVSGSQLKSIWLSESKSCEGNRVDAGWYREGLWIFRRSTTRGGLSVVTEEISVCGLITGQATPAPIWYSLHGGGAPLIVVSCEMNEKPVCLMYQDGYAHGAWSE
jgi:hypothetical protein